MEKMSSYKKLEKEAVSDGIKKFVVGAVVVNESKVLLLERPKDDFMGGIFELPSGNLESGETLEEGLFRELEEETGLVIKRIVSYIGHFDYLSGSGKKARQFNFLVEVNNFDKIKLTEHDSFVWADIREVHKYKVTDAVKNIIKDCYNTQKIKMKEVWDNKEDEFWNDL